MLLHQYLYKFLHLGELELEIEVLIFHAFTPPFLNDFNFLLLRDIFTLIGLFNFFSPPHWVKSNSFIWEICENRLSFLKTQMVKLLSVLSSILVELLFCIFNSEGYEFNTHKILTFFLHFWLEGFDSHKCVFCCSLKSLVCLVFNLLFFF